MKCLEETPVYKRHPVCQLLLFIGVYTCGVNSKGNFIFWRLKELADLETTAHHLGLGNPDAAG